MEVSKASVSLVQRKPSVCVQSCCRLPARAPRPTAVTGLLCAIPIQPSPPQLPPLGGGSHFRAGGPGPGAAIRTRLHPVPGPALRCRHSPRVPPLARRKAHGATPRPPRPGRLPAPRQRGKRRAGRRRAGPGQAEPSRAGPPGAPIPTTGRRT